MKSDFAYRILIYLIIFCLSGPCLCQPLDLYGKAYAYIYKSKKLKDFMVEIGMNEGIIIKKIKVSDSIIKNNPYPFLCAILRKKTKRNDKCIQLIEKDRLKVYDSITGEYKGYVYSNSIRLPFKRRSSKDKRTMILSFSDIFKGTLTAEVHFQKGKALTSQSTKSILFYFAFFQNGDIRDVFEDDIQNYH